MITILAIINNIFLILAVWYLTNAAWLRFNLHQFEDFYSALGKAYIFMGIAIVVAAIAWIIYLV